MLSKFAFTFIEIMVVISIISIVSFTSVFYFNDFIDSQEIKGILHNFSSQVELFDAETEQGKIYDYEVFL
jgi:prepilin-type N-terminal cleavage/methylation domain-containing protein